MRIWELCAEAHEASKKAGWWDEERNQGEMIALMHSELSEALEAIRKPGPSEHCPEISGVAEEMADVMIRIGDFCAAFGIDLEEAIKLKMRFNATRPHKHGGKAF